MNSTNYKLLSLSLLVLAMGCGSKKKHISAHMSLHMQLAKGAESTLSLNSGADAALLADDPDSVDYTSMVNNPDKIPMEALARSIVPESLLYEIAAITADDSLTGYTGSVPFTCPSSSASECLVDLADAAAVAKFLATANLEVTKSVGEKDSSDAPLATIKAFSVNQCLPGESTSTVKFKGKTSFMGHTWYTTAGDKVLTANAADYDYISLSSPSCVGIRSIVPTPIELKPNDSIKVSLFVNLADIVKLRFISGNNGMGGCKYGASRSSCIDDAKTVPYLGDANPSVELYKIQTTDKNLPASSQSEPLMATMIVFIDSASNEPIGATFRSAYDGTNGGWTHAPGDVGAIKKNGDGTYTIMNWESDGASAPSETTLTTTFNRSSHSGTFVTRNYGGSGTMDWTYTATKL